MVSQAWRQACYNPQVWRTVNLSKGAGRITDKALAQMAGRYNTAAKTLCVCVCVCAFACDFVRMRDHH
jgi:hypothetical protein